VGTGVHPGHVRARVRAARLVSGRGTALDLAVCDHHLRGAQRAPEGKAVPTARDRPHGGDRGLAPRTTGRAGPEATARSGDRRVAGWLPHGVCDARRRGLHARGDRRGARHRDGNFEGAVVACPRQVARGIGGLRRRMGVMTEDRLERLLRDAAQDYHRPPETPREELWRRIIAVREARRRRRALSASPWLRWGIGIAAVLALGIGIGRWTARPPSLGPAPIATTGVSDQGLEQRSVLLRLRTANPAGPGPVRTQGAL